MIKDRPAHLIAQPGYRGLPKEPFAVRFDALPELLRQSLGPLGGIQPVTNSMFEAAGGGPLRDMPSAGEIEMFRKMGTQFQMIFAVLSIADLRTVDGVPHAIPYALTLLPASKRGEVWERGIDHIAKLDAVKYLEAEPSYVGFDPFSGTWSLFGSLSLFTRDVPFDCHLDELGLVVEQYFLATTFDALDVLDTPGGMPNEEAERKYRAHRSRRLYAPFQQVRVRRVWGAESPIELFLFQELLRRGMMPELQVLFCDDGSMHSSLYHLWRDVEFRHMPGVITEADMYLPDQKLAIFCDSTRHHRGGRQRAKDQAISERLEALGIRVVRVPGRMIVNDLSAAADLVPG